MNQNLYKDFTKNAVEYNIKNLKTQMFISLIKIIRENEWNKKETAKNLKISKKKTKKLLKGSLEKITLDNLVEMLVLTGHEVETNFNQENELNVSFSLKK